MIDNYCEQDCIDGPCATRAKHVCGKPLPCPDHTQATIDRIKGRFRYELRDPALPQTTVEDMTALLDSHDEQGREIERLQKLVCERFGCASPALAYNHDYRCPRSEHYRG